jgi:hypothetical protein
VSELTRAFTQHAPNGDFMRTPEQMAKDHRAAEMRSQGFTYQQIGESLGMTRQGAHKAVQRAIAEIPKEGTKEALNIELAKIDRIERYYNSVMARTHFKVGNTGRIVVDPDGQPMTDEGPRMDAAAGILKAQAQRAKLLGLNAPTVTRGELVIHDVERDSTKIIEAQFSALKAMGLDDRLEEFRANFVAALASGEGEVVDAEWSSETMGLPEP